MTTYKVARSGTHRHTFSQLLTRQRKRVGVSQAEVGRRIGQTSGYVSRLESGDRQPSRDTLERLADALGLTDGERFALGAAAGYCLLEPSQAWVIEEVTGMLDCEEQKGKARNA